MTSFGADFGRGLRATGLGFSSFFGASAAIGLGGSAGACVMTTGAAGGIATGLGSGFVSGVAAATGAGAAGFGFGAGAVATGAEEPRSHSSTYSNQAAALAPATNTATRS